MNKKSSYTFYEVVSVERPTEYIPKTSYRQFNMFRDSNLWKDLLYLMRRRRAMTQITLEDGLKGIEDVQFSRGQLNALKFMEDALLVELEQMIKRKEQREVENA